MIPAGTEATWESLRGKPVVIEFWATWCGPCIAEIPHLNELASRFKEVQFISITDEAASVVEAFLAKRPISGLVGLDRARSTFGAYGVDAIPQTMLVDKEGVLRGVVSPRQVTEAVLADLIAGRPLGVQRLPRGSRTFAAAAVEPLFAVMVRPGALGKRGGVFRIDPGTLEGENIPLKTIIAHAYSTFDTRVEGPEDLLATRYDFCVLLPRGVQGEVSILRETLERTFQLKVRQDTREVDALVLKVVDPKLPKAQRRGYTMRDLARSLEWRLKRFIVDETSLGGEYDIEFPQNRDALEKFVREQLGLELSPARRSIQMLVVESLEAPSFRLNLP
jgi:thiol-disulfide isomerase/thioredoxin